MNGNHFDIHDLKREYEKGRKQGAVEELEKIAKILNSNYTGVEDWLRVSKYVVKRLGELK